MSTQRHAILKCEVVLSGRVAHLREPTTSERDIGHERGEVERLMIEPVLFVCAQAPLGRAIVEQVVPEALVVRQRFTCERVQNEVVLTPIFSRIVDCYVPEFIVSRHRETVLLVEICQRIRDFIGFYCTVPKK